MAQKIQQVADSLTATATANNKTVQDIKDKSYRKALKDLSADLKKDLTEAAFLKSKRLASLELTRTRLQAILDTPNWTEIVTAIFPKASFQIHAHKQRIIIEVNE